MAFPAHTPELGAGRTAGRFTAYGIFVLRTLDFFFFSSCHLISTTANLSN